jgi:hypothetical protein
MLVTRYLDAGIGFRSNGRGLNPREERAGGQSDEGKGTRSEGFRAQNNLKEVWMAGLHPMRDDRCHCYSDNPAIEIAGLVFCLFSLFLRFFAVDLCSEILVVVQPRGESCRQNLSTHRASVCMYVFWQCKYVSMCSPDERNSWPCTMAVTRTHLPVGFNGALVLVPDLEFVTSKYATCNHH